MKTKHFFISTLAGMFLFASCSKGPSEETMKSIGDFETAWTDLGNKAVAWSSDCKACYDNCMSHCSTADADTTVKDPACKAMCDSAHAICKGDMEKCTGMWKEWESFKTEWDTMTAQFVAWKDLAAKGDVSDEDAKKSLEEWNGKKSAAEEKISVWSSALETCKADCETHMKGCMDAHSKAMEMQSKMGGDKGKGKGKKA